MIMITSLSILQRRIRDAGPQYRLGIDLDGVVIDHSKQFMDVCSAFGFPLKSWQVNTNMLNKFLSPDTNTVIQHIVYAKRRSRALEMQDSVETIGLLRNHLDIVSVQKRPEAEKKLWKWLKKFGVLNSIAKKHIHLWRSREKKLHCIHALKPDFFIDDGLEILEHLPRQTIPILFDPWGINKYFYKNRKGIFVIKTWKEISRVFHGAFSC